MINPKVRDKRVLGVCKGQQRGQRGWSGKSKWEKSMNSQEVRRGLEKGKNIWRILYRVFMARVTL